MANLFDAICHVMHIEFGAEVLLCGNNIYLIAHRAQSRLADELSTALCHRAMPSGYPRRQRFVPCRCRRICGPRPVKR